MLEQARTYSLYVDRIGIDGDLAPQVYYFGEVTRVRLKFERTKQRAYYQCMIDTKRGTIALRHLTYRGVGNFEDLRAEYTPFVRALLAQIAHRHTVEFRGGSMANFIGALIGAPLMAILLVVAVHFGRIGSGILAGVMLAICLLMIGPSRPRRFDPLAPPADLLPPVTPESRDADVSP